MKHGKKYVDSFKAIDKAKQYDAPEALELAAKGAKAKFDETIELHIRLGVDSRHADQQVRGAVVLPNGTGKTVRVCVFCKEDKYEAAKAAGADYVGGMDLVEKITKENWMDFDVVVASPDMMGVVGRLGKIEYRLDKTNIIHCPIGKASFGVEKLEQNFNTLINAVVKAKPAAAKGQYLKSVVVASTMGPGIKISTAKYGN